MADSASLRLDDVRAVFRLVGECRDVGYDPERWLTRMAEGLIRLLDAQVVLGGEFRLENRRAVPLAAVDVGWSSDRARRRYAEWQARSDLPDNPVYDLFLGLDDAAPTVGSGDLIPVRDWEESEYYKQLMVPSDVGDTMLSRRAAPGGTPHIVTASRAVGDAAFTAREKAVFALFHTELAEHFGTVLATATDPVARLSPRLLEVLRCLLEGDSEKQAALRLGLSPSTVHDHVKRLYRHFGVTSRAELMAYFLRRARRV